jgi:hypothetical protein
VNQLWARAEQQVTGWRSINLRLAGLDEGPATLHRATGEVVPMGAVRCAVCGPPASQLDTVYHTGDYNGLADTPESEAA